MNKKIIVPFVAVLILAIGLIWFFNHRRSDISDELQAALSGDNSGSLSQSNYSEELEKFYADREYLEVWLFNGSLSKSGEELLKQIEDSKFDGLQPADYHLEEIYALSSDPDRKNKKFKSLSPEEKVDLESKLSDRFFNLPHDLEKVR